MQKLIHFRWKLTEKSISKVGYFFIDFSLMLQLCHSAMMHSKFWCKQCASIWGGCIQPVYPPHQCPADALGWFMWCIAYPCRPPCKKTRHGKEVSSMGVKCDSMTFNRIYRGDHIVVQIPGWMTKFALAQKWDKLQRMPHLRKGRSNKGFHAHSCLLADGYWSGIGWW